MKRFLNIHTNVLEVECQTKKNQSSYPVLNRMLCKNKHTEEKGKRKKKGRMDAHQDILL